MRPGSIVVAVLALSGAIPMLGQTPPPRSPGTGHGPGPLGAILAPHRHARPLSTFCTGSKPKRRFHPSYSRGLKKASRRSTTHQPAFCRLSIQLGKLEDRHLAYHTYSVVSRGRYVRSADTLQGPLV